MRKRYSRSYTVLSFLTMFSYRELPLGDFFFCGAVNETSPQHISHSCLRSARRTQAMLLRGR